MDILEKPRIDKRVYLSNIIKTNPNSLKAAVAKEALNYHGIEAFFNDILQYGCKSGLVTGLIYDHNIHYFFDRYYRAIEQIRLDIETNLGESLTIPGDLKSTLAWTAFEEIAFRMAMEMGLVR